MKNIPERRSVVFYIDEISVLDYSQIIESSADDVTRSVSSGRELGYFQYDLPNIPDFLDQFIEIEGPYTYDEFQSVLRMSTWSGQDSALDDTSILILPL